LVTVLVVAGLASPLGASAKPIVSGKGLDHAFGGGSVQLPFRGPGNSQSAENCVATKGGGAIVLTRSGKWGSSPEDDFYTILKGSRERLYAYDRAGRLIKKFGRGGIADLGSDPIDHPIQIETDAQGRTYLLSTERIAKSKRTRYLLRRLTTRGVNDRSFANGGVNIAVAEKSPNIGFTQLDDGRVAVFESGRRYRIRMFRANGRPDRAFGDRGSLRASEPIEVMRALPGGELAVGGTTYVDSTGTQPVIVRVLSRTGAPATEWGDKGTITVLQSPAAVQAVMEEDLTKRDLPWVTDYVELNAIEPTPHHGLSLALSSSYGAKTNRWFATFRRGSATPDDAASHFLIEASGVERGTELDVQAYWSVPDGKGGWFGVTYENTGNAAVWSVHVSPQGKRVRKRSAQPDFLGTLDLNRLSLVPRTNTIVGCGWHDHGTFAKPLTRGFVFKLRLG
jgi:hypothetical protein